MAHRDKAKQAIAAKKHYEANKDKMKARARAHDEKKKKAVKSFLLEYLSKNFCVDCGNSNPIVLEFDHKTKKEKRFFIGEANCRGYSLKSVIAEVAKCDIRCANCHRIKTYEEEGFRSRHEVIIAE